MKFAREIATLLMLEEQAKLFLAHHLEVSTNPEMVLAPDPKQYVAMEEKGMLRWFTIRAKFRYEDFTEHEDVVGYFVFAVTPFMHHVKAIQAHQLLLFIHPAHRTGATFDKFLHFVVDELSRNDQVTKIFFTTSPRNTLDKLFERKEMTLVSRTYEYDVNRQFHPEPEFDPTKQKYQPAKTGDH